MTSAKSHADISGLQRFSIREAAKHVGCSESEMAGFFLAGGEWYCNPGVELEKMLVDTWNEYSSK